MWSRRPRVRVPSLTSRRPCKQQHRFAGREAAGRDGVRTGSKLSSELGSGEPSDDPPSTVAEQVAARLLGDEADLYLAFNPRLVRIVQRSVDAPHEVVDDACAFAWVQFMRVQPDRERNWRAWLITTAEREAWRLRREEAKTLSFETRRRAPRCTLSCW